MSFPHLGLFGHFSLMALTSRFGRIAFRSVFIVSAICLCTGVVTEEDKDGNRYFDAPVQVPLRVPVIPLPSLINSRKKSFSPSGLQGTGQFLKSEIKQQLNFTYYTAHRPVGSGA